MFDIKHRATPPACASPELPQRQRARNASTLQRGLQSMRVRLRSRRAEIEDARLELEMLPQHASDKESSFSGKHIYGAPRLASPNGKSGSRLPNVLRWTSDRRTGESGRQEQALIM